MKNMEKYENLRIIITLKQIYKWKKINTFRGLFYLFSMFQFYEFFRGRFTFHRTYIKLHLKQN